MCWKEAEIASVTKTETDAREGKRERGVERERQRRSRKWSRTQRGRTTATSELAWDATNRRRTTRLGYVGGAVIQPNAQVCRRLAGASLECRPPLPSCQSVGLGPSVPLPYTQPPKGPTATSSFTTTIANYGTQAQVRTHVRLCARICVCVCECVCACVRLDDATSRPLTAISAAGHQRVPTGPNRPGQLASVTFARLLPVLSLFLFFFIFLPLLFSAILLFVSLAARPSVSSPSNPLVIAFFLLSRVRFYVFLFFTS